MSKPGERGFTGDNEIFSSSEDIRLTGKKTEVQKDDITVKDDLQDYIYMNPVKRKKSSKKSSHHKSSHRRKKKMKAWKKVLIAIPCVLMSLVLIVVGVVAFLLAKGRSELFTDDLSISAPETIDAKVQEGGDYIVYNGETYKYNTNVTSMLFMGVDKRDMEDLGDKGAGGQADVLVLMAMDFSSRKISLINIPRDTMTDVAIYSVSGYYTGMDRQQICLAYAYGDGKESSCTNQVASVKRVFYNIPINTYYALDLDGIAAINDAVGGVDVVSPETIEKFTSGEQYHLEGKDAERFVRARVKDTAEANNIRMERQKVYTQAFMSKVMGEVKSNPQIAVDLFNDSAPYSCTDIDASKVAYLAKEVALGGSLKTEIITVPGKTTLNANEQAEFTIDEKAFFEQFLSVFYEKM